MEYLIGIALAAFVGLMASLTGLDKERGFYAVVLIAIAAYYILFAAMAAPLDVVTAESLPMAIFALVAVFGFKRNLWYLVVGLAAHGIFDAMHARVISNPGVPAWWPGFCMAFDVTAAIYLALRLTSFKRSNNHDAAAHP